MIAPAADAPVAANAVELVLPQHDVMQAKRHPAAPVRWTHEREGRHTESGSDVKRPGVVAHQGGCLCDHGGHLAQVDAFTNDRALTRERSERSNQVPFARPSDDEDIAVVVVQQPTRQFGEIVDRPALRGVVGPEVEADQRPAAQPARGQPSSRFIAFFVQQVNVRQTPHGLCAQLSHRLHNQVRDVPVPIHPAQSVEEHFTTVSAIPDANRGSAEAGHHGWPKVVPGHGVDDGVVALIGEPSCLEHNSNRTGRLLVLSPDHHPVDMRVMPQQRRVGPAGQHGQVRPRKRVFDRAQGRRRQNHVADAVGPDEEDLAELCGCAHRRSRPQPQHPGARDQQGPAQVQICQLHVGLCGG